MQTNGPHVGNIFSFAKNGVTLFALSYLEGVYRSADFGASRILANAGLFISTNDGDAWTKNNAELGNINILYFRFVRSRSCPDIIYRNGFRAHPSGSAIGII